MAKLKTDATEPQESVMTGGKAVLVTTEYKGVFFGYMDGVTSGEDDAEPTTVVLKQARNCIYWSEDVKGFLGLASSGPTRSCRIGPAVPTLKLFKVTSIVECSPEALIAWNKAAWNG